MSVLNVGVWTRRRRVGEATVTGEESMCVTALHLGFTNGRNFHPCVGKLKNYVVFIGESTADENDPI